MVKKIIVLLIAGSAFLIALFVAAPHSFATQYNFTRNLTVGSSGEDVVALQQILINDGFLTAVSTPTGYFGQATKAALINFQTANDISPAVGYFGPLTRGFADAMTGSQNPTTDVSSSLSSTPPATAAVPTTATNQTANPNVQSSASSTSAFMCAEFATDSASFAQQLNAAMSQKAQIAYQVNQLLQVPSNLSGAQGFAYLYSQMVAAQGSQSQQINQLEQMIQNFSLTTFGTDQPALFRQIFQNWINTHESSISAITSAFQLATDYQDSLPEVEASQQAWNQAFAEYNANESQLTASFESAASNLQQIYSSAFPDCSHPLNYASISN